MLNLTTLLPQLVKNPQEFYAKEFARVTVGELALVTVVLIAISQVAGAVNVATTGGAVDVVVQESLKLGVLSIVLLTLSFVAVAHMISQGNTHKLSPMDAAKVLFSGVLIQQVCAAIAAVSSVVMMFLSGGFRASDFSEVSANPSSLALPVAQGLGFAGVGMVLFVVFIAGMVLSLRAQYVGLQQVGKFTKQQALMTVFIPVIISLAIGMMFPANLGIAPSPQ